MASRATLRAWRVSDATSRFSSISPGTLQSAPAFLSVPSSTSILIQKRSLIASLGGTTALFVGASVLTVAETTLFAARAVFARLTAPKLLQFRP